MSPDLSVRTGMAVATFKGPLSGEYCEHKTMERRTRGRRRVFVQTESGCVLGVELDRSDNARTVKRRLQLALYVPTAETSLICGDMVLKNDLSVVRNDSPLLLTRKYLNRSSSSPCMSPTGQDVQHRDQSGPIEILGSSHFTIAKELVHDIVKAMQMGVSPIPVHSGLGGAYYFRNCDGENVAIVKPTDEEPYAPNNPKGFVGKVLGQPGLKRSVRVGETGFREVAAYLLDHDHFANVPATALVKVTHPIFNVNDGLNGNRHKNDQQVSRIASLQQYIPHDYDASDHGTSNFPVAAIHRIGILDIRILNTDRHSGNLLVRKLDGVGRFGQVELVPIDHGLCLPECLEDPYFEWIHWPQASIPFSEDELRYIDHLDPFRDSEMLRMELPMIREACLRVLVLCTTFLKEAAAFGLCLAEIGEMMSRAVRGHNEELSELEQICLEARKTFKDREMSPSEAKIGGDALQFDIDCEEGKLNSTSNIKANETPSQFGSKGGSGKGQHSKLEEGVENEIPLSSNECSTFVQVPISNVSKLSMSLENVTFQENEAHLTGKACGNRSMDELLPVNSSFVKVSDMNEGEWVQFLNKFQKLLFPAFMNRKCGSVGQMRLGTSCQF